MEHKIKFCIKLQDIVAETLNKAYGDQVLSQLQVLGDTKYYWKAKKLIKMGQKQGLLSDDDNDHWWINIDQLVFNRGCQPEK